MKVVLTHYNLRTHKGLVIVDLFDLRDLRKAFDMLDSQGEGKGGRAYHLKMRRNCGSCTH
jgi:hypothetical protein